MGFDPQLLTPIDAPQAAKPSGFDPSLLTPVSAPVAPQVSGVKTGMGNADFSQVPKILDWHPTLVPKLSKDDVKGYSPTMQKVIGASEGIGHSVEGMLTPANAAIAGATALTGGIAPELGALLKIALPTLFGSAATKQAATTLGTEAGTPSNQTTPFERSKNIGGAVADTILTGFMANDARKASLEPIKTGAPNETANEGIPKKQAEPANASGKTPAVAPQPNAQETHAIRPNVQSDAGTQVLTFKTSKGSEYSVNPDKTTTRNKAARPEHPGEQGIQPKSQQTYYVSKEDAQKLGEIQAQGGGVRAVQKLSDGRIGVRYLDGKDAGKFETRTVVTPKTEPSKGLYPVEVWDDGKNVHFGNEIVSVANDNQPHPITAKAQEIYDNPTSRKKSAAKEILDTHRADADPKQFIADVVSGKVQNTEALEAVKVLAGKKLSADYESKITQEPVSSGKTDVANVDNPEPQISRGPGAGAKGEPGTYSAIKQLSDQLATSPIKGVKEDVSAATKIADAWAAGKSGAEKAFGRMLAVGSTLKETQRGVREPNDVDRRVAEFDYKTQRSTAESVEAKKTIKEAVPNKTLREATAIYTDAGGDVAKIQDALSKLPAKTPPNVRRAIELASNLPEEGKRFADHQRDFFARRLETAQQEGVIDKGLEDYWTHIWKNEENTPDSIRAALNNGRVSTYFNFARERKISTLLDGILAGKTPELDPADVLPFYSHSLDRSIASRQFVKSLSDIEASDKRPAVVPSGSSPTPDKTPGSRLIKPLSTPAKFDKAGNKIHEYGDYEDVNHPAMRGWKWLGKDDKGNDIMLEGQLKVHPEFAPRLQRFMDRRLLTPSGFTKGLQKISGEVKAAKFGLPSAFHTLHVGSHALWHWTNPIVEKAPIEWDTPETQFAIEKGHLKLAPSPEELRQFGEGLSSSGSLVNKIPYIGKVSQGMSEWLFQDYIPKLKLNTFKNAYERNLKWAAKDIESGKVTKEQIADRVGDAVNSAYGELNQLFLGKYGRDPRFQRALRLFFLAPDFGEARLRFVGKALTKYGHEERIALATSFFALYTAARVGNYMSTGDPQWDVRHAFEVKHGDKWYGMRSVIGDVDRLITDSRDFVMNRVNPVTTRTAIEAMTGRDYRGVKRTGVQQLKDLAETVVPIQFNGLTRDDQSFGEGFLRAMGVSAKDEKPEQFIGRKAADFKKSHPSILGTPFQEDYDQDADKLRKLRLDIADGDETAARKEYLRLTQELGPKSKEAIAKSMHRHLSESFVPKAQMGEFTKSLSPEEQETMRRANNRKSSQLQMFKRISQ